MDMCIQMKSKLPQHCSTSAHKTFPASGC